MVVFNLFLFIFNRLPFFLGRLPFFLGHLSIWVKIRSPDSERISTQQSVPLVRTATLVDIGKRVVVTGQLEPT